MAKTKIEWATHTWNPVTGCTPVSEGCKNCYAEKMAKRLAGRFGYPKDKPFKITVHLDKIDEPLKWRKPRDIFVCSMGDLFHEDVEPIVLARIFQTIERCPQHTFFLLTKRPEIALKHSQNLMLERYFWLSNVWIGITAENQRRAEERIPILLQLPAAARFVSIEPMLSVVNLGEWRKLNWVICGGETGHGARPMHPDWVKKLKEQCQKASIPFFFKHWGEWASATQMSASTVMGHADLRQFKQTHVQRTTLYRVGRKLAGRTLDGKEYNEIPTKKGEQN